MRPDRQPSEASRPVRVAGGTALPRDGDRRLDFRPARQPANSLLKDQLDLAITEIAVMWVLHCGTLPRRPPRSLTRDIVDFYPDALSTILRVDALRNAKHSDLRLIYFKGLIVALTHPRAEMIEAVRRADRTLESDTISTEQSEISERQSTERQSTTGLPSEDQDTLDHIADALGSFPGPSH